MHQAKTDTVADEIDNQRPVGLLSQLPPTNATVGPSSSNFLKNTRRANISEMPNFIHAFRYLGDVWRQMVMRVG